MTRDHLPSYTLALKGQEEKVGKQSYLRLHQKIK